MKYRDLTIDDFLADEDAERLPAADSYCVKLIYVGPAPSWTRVEITVPGIRTEGGAAMLAEFGELIRTESGFAMEVGAEWLSLANDQVRARRLNAYGRRQFRNGGGVSNRNWDRDIALDDPKSTQLLTGPYMLKHCVIAAE